MTEEMFWGLIDQAVQGGAASADPRKLADVLKRQRIDDVVEFARLFNDKLCDLNHWRLWGAGYVISGGMSDDGFHYFRSWLIGKGKAVFDLALENPDGLGAYVDDEEVDNEALEYVAAEVLKTKGFADDLRIRAARKPDSDPSGEPFDEDTVYESFPKLATQFG